MGRIYPFKEYPVGGQVCLLTSKKNKYFVTCDRCGLKVSINTPKLPCDWELVNLKKQSDRKLQDLCPACLFMLTEAEACCEAHSEHRIKRGKKILETIGRDMTLEEKNWLKNNKGCQSQ